MFTEAILMSASPMSIVHYAIACANCCVQIMRLVEGIGCKERRMRERAVCEHCENLNYNAKSNGNPNVNVHARLVKIQRKEKTYSIRVLSLWWSRYTSWRL